MKNRLPQRVYYPNGKYGEDYWGECDFLVNKLKENRLLD
jgi:hypothetical protein